MPDFSQLNKLAATEQTEREYIFENVVIGKDEKTGADVKPSIWFRPMIDSNPIYMGERIRLSVQKAEDSEKETKANKKKRLLSVETIEDQVAQERREDIAMMAKTCAVRWGVGMPDVDGKVHPLDETVAREFLSALPWYVIDPCRGWVQNVYNFVDRYALVPDELGNSSPKS